LKDVDVMWAARLAAAGFVSIAGCWQFSASPPNPIRFYELNITPVACPKMLTESVDAVAALIAAGKQQPGVQTNEVGLYGMTAGGEVALQVIAARRDVRAAALDSA
jgi:dienelactone hydrolase